MAKSIKRAVVFILAVAILSLTAVCVFFVSNVNNDSYLNTKDMEVANSNERAVTDIGKTYTDVGGDSATIINRWNEIRAESYEMNKFIKIVLNSNWVLDNCLDLRDYQRIIIDLNGYSITRNIASPIANGNVFAIQGYSKLVINDSKFAQDPEGILEKAEQLADSMNLVDYATNPGLWESQSKKLAQDIISATGVGYIGGGNTTGNGGAIWVSDATLEINGGMICSNYGNMGGGLYVAGTSSVLQFNNGIICANYARSDSGGGGIYVSAPVANINGGLIIGNRAFVRGGAINMVQGSISNCVIYKNWQEQMGALYLNNHSRLMLTNVRVDSNVTTKTGGGGAYITGNNQGSIVDMYNVSFLNNKCLTDDTDSGAGLQVCYASQLYLQDCIFRDNYSKTGGVGIDFSSKGSWDRTSKLQIGGFLDMSGNLNAEGQNCDISIKSNGRIRIEAPLTMNTDNPDQKPIYLSFVESDGMFHSFTSSYSTFTHNIDPNKYFTCGIDSYKTVLNSFGELMFAKDKSITEYDFVYLENGYRKNYSDNDKLHGYNDSDIEHFVLGDISSNTSINEFIVKVEPLGIDKNNMQLFDSQGNQVYSNGVANNNVSALLDNGNELAIGTGWYIVTNGETIYLSVLGDINGDGRISASDVSILRQLANDKAVYESLSVEAKLASMVINKGELTTADAEIVRNVIDKLLDINIFY